MAIKEFLADLLVPLLRFGSASGPTVQAGSGSPEGVISAPVGSTFMRTDGGTGTAQYRKETGGTGNTGWVANAAGGGASPSGSGVVTVPSLSFDRVETIAAPGVVPGQRVFVAIGAHGDSDENSPELLNIGTISATAGADEITITLTFTAATSGPINIIWSAS